MKRSIYATLSLGILGAVGCTESGGIETAPTTEMLVSMCATADVNTFTAGPCCLNQDTGAAAVCTDHPPPPDLCELADVRAASGVVLTPIAAGIQIGESPNLAIFGDECDGPPPPPDEPPPEEPDCVDKGYIVVGNEQDRLVFTLGPVTTQGREITVYQYAADVAPGTKVMADNDLLAHPVLDAQQVYAKLETELYVIDPVTGVQTFVGYPHKQADYFPATCESYQC